MQDLRIQSNEPQPSRPEIKRKPEREFDSELEEAKSSEKKLTPRKGKTDPQEKTKDDSHDLNMSSEVLAKMLLNVLTERVLTKAPAKSAEKTSEAEGGKKIPLLNIERNKVPPTKTPGKASQPADAKTTLVSSPQKDVQETKISAPTPVIQPTLSTVEPQPQPPPQVPGQVRLETALRFEHAASPTSNLVEVREFKSAKSGGEVQMRLDVEGENVELRLSVKDGVAQVSMRTIRPEVAKLIQDSVHELVAGLEAQGLEVSVDVSQDERTPAQKVAHNVQNEGEVHDDAPKEQRWHYMAIRGRIYVVA